jgi:hypothetical protein
VVGIGGCGLLSLGGAIPAGYGHASRNKSTDLGKPMAKIDPRDPFRYVKLAVNASRVIGVLSIGIGIIGAIGLLMTGASPVIGFVVGLFFVVPGLLYLFFAAQLQDHKTWAAIVLMIMAILHSCMMGISLVGQLIRWMNSDLPNSDGGALFGLVLSGIFCLTAILLIAYLSRCFRILRVNAIPPQSYGFQPVIQPMPAPPVTVAPVNVSQQADFQTE